MKAYDLNFSRLGKRDSNMGYTLLDDIYFDTLKFVTEELNRRDLPYAVVGGCANQVWLAKAIAGRREINRSEDSLDPILRPTKDIDIASYQTDEFNDFLNNLPSIVGPRSGFGIHVGPSKVTVKKGNDKITVQYISETSGMPIDVYRYIVDHAIEVPLAKGNVMSYPIVGCPEHIVAVKLSQEGNREKHNKDVYDMLYNFDRRQMEFDDEEVRSLLKSLGKEAKMDSIARIRQSLR